MKTSSTRLNKLTSSTDPQTVVEKVAIVRLQYSQDHYVVFRAFTRHGKQAWLLLPPKDAANPDKICDAIMNFDLHFVDRAQLVWAAKLAANANPERRGILAVSNGWIGDGYNAFVYGDRVLRAPHPPSKDSKSAGREFVLACPDFDTSRKANLAGRGSVPKDMSAARSSKGSSASWRKSIGKLALNSSAMMTAIVAPFAAPLLAPMDLDAAMMYLAGETSGGKTTTLLAAASVIGIGRKSLIPNWKATDPAIEELAQLQFGDMLFPMDELSHVGDDSAVFDKIDSAAYLFDAGASKRKHERSASAISRRPKRTAGSAVIVLTSYEKSLSEIEENAAKSFRDGVRARIIEIPMRTHKDSFGIFDRMKSKSTDVASQTEKAGVLAKKIRAAAKANHGQIFGEWMKYLLTDLAGAVSRVEAGSKVFLQKASFDRTRGLDHRRVAHFAFLYGVGVCAIEAGFLPWTEIQFRNAITRCLRASQKLTQKQKTNRLSDLDVFKNFLEKKGRISPWPKPGDMSKAVAHVDGWKRLENGQAMYRVKVAAFRRWFPIKRVRDALERRLTVDGILIVGPNGKPTYQARVPNSKARVRVYHFSLTPPR